jgi:hypothetical protein
VVTNISFKKDILNHYNDSQVLYSKSDIDFNYLITCNNNIDYDKHRMNNLTLSTIYDNIGAIYLFSDKVKSIWTGIANELKQNIKIFNGDGNVFTFINVEVFIKGINILAGCSTRTIVNGLNSRLNCEDKYFIGFDGYKHNHGTGFVICQNQCLMTESDFHTEYNRPEYDDIFPIIKLIRIYYNNFKTRSCRFLSPDNIYKKLKDMMKSISPENKLFNCSGATKLTKCYFDSSVSVEIVDDKHYDTEFEKFIDDIIVSHKEKERLEMDEKREREIAYNTKKQDSLMQYDKLINDIRQLFNGDEYRIDITSDYDTYSKYLKTTNLVIVDNLFLEDGVLKNDEFTYKLFMIKKDENFYIEIIEYKSDNTISEITYTKFDIDTDDIVFDIDTDGIVLNIMTKKNKSKQYQEYQPDDILVPFEEDVEDDDFDD